MFMMFTEGTAQDFQSARMVDCNVEKERKNGLKDVSKQLYNIVI